MGRLTLPGARRPAPRVVRMLKGVLSDARRLGEGFFPSLMATQAERPAGKPRRASSAPK